MFTTRDGSPWEPEYLISIDGAKCIGCGRCFKVCARDVMTLMGINDDDELVSCDDDDEEIVRKVMVMSNAGNCVGCAACSRVCPTGSQTHVPASKIAA
jgi:Nif-specific ferredoxin III